MNNGASPYEGRGVPPVILVDPGLSSRGTVIPDLVFIHNFNCGKSAHRAGVLKNAVWSDGLRNWFHFRQQATPSSLSGGLMLIQRH